MVNNWLICNQKYIFYLTQSNEDAFSYEYYNNLMFYQSMGILCLKKISFVRKFIEKNGKYSTWIHTYTSIRSAYSNLIQKRQNRRKGNTQSTINNPNNLILTNFLINFVSFSIWPLTPITSTMDAKNKMIFVVECIWKLMGHKCALLNDSLSLSL